MWKVYGYDTFARETYLIGEFASEAEAEQALKKTQSEIEDSQSEDLRDKLWIEPPTA